MHSYRHPAVSSRSPRGRLTDRGVIGLLMVIMIGSIMLAAGIVVAFVGQSQVVLSGDVDSEHVTRMLSASCVEEAVHRLKLSTAYTGGTVPLGSSTCTVTVSGSGTTRTLSAVTTYGIYTKTITASLLQKSNVAGTASGWSVTAWSESDPP